MPHLHEQPYCLHEQGSCIHERLFFQQGPVEDWNCRQERIYLQTKPLQIHILLEYEPPHPVLSACRAGSPTDGRGLGLRRTRHRHFGICPPPLHHAGRPAADAHRVHLAGRKGLHLDWHIERFRALRRIGVHPLS